MSHMSAEDHEQIWVLLEGGETLTDIGEAIGRSITTVRSFVLRHGGQRPLGFKASTHNFLIEGVVLWLLIRDVARQGV